MPQLIDLRCAPIARGQGHTAGRALLRQMVETFTGQPMPPIAVTQRGKPYFPDSPLHFSISHTPKHVFCALSHSPIGIDAEEMDRNISLALAQKILSPAEYSRWEAAPDKRDALLRLWILKEARAKFSGTGLNGYPDHTNFSPDDPRIIQMDGCLLAVIQEEDYAL